MIECNFENKHTIKNIEQQLHIEIYYDIIPEDVTHKLLNTLKHEANWRDNFITKSGKPSKKRNKCIYGSISYYSAVFRGKTLNTKVYNWSRFPILEELANTFSKLTNDNYNTCVLQYYANNHVGINPHRDKEVTNKDVITSLSIGSTRIMRFERGDQIYNIELPNGSLCVIYPPTNNKWLHSIVTENITKDERISLVFRNHHN